jgi:hypothetical protein
MIFTTKALIRFTTHSAYISISEDQTIHIFKYNNSSCDMDVFTDQFDAAEYILEPLPTSYYQVTVEGDLD